MVTSFLENFFKQYVGYDFTAQLEQNLDKVSNGDMNWKDFLNNFWGEFNACSEKALELRTRDRERKLLKKIQQAIGRITNKEYGFCEETGEPIGLKRLIARPVATLCIAAQEKHEKNEKVYADN